MSNSKRFTDTKVKALKPKERPYKTYEKGNDPGFCIQVSPSGRRVFYLAYTFEGKKRFHNLGAYSSEFTLAKAREACRVAQILIDSGTDPQVERSRTVKKEEAERKRIEAKKRATTVNEALDHYITTLSEQTAYEVNNVFTNSHCDIRKRIGSMKMQDVTDDDIDALLDLHIKRGTHRNAGKLYAFMRSAFKKAKLNKKFKLKKWHNPFDDVAKPDNSNSNALNRALSAEDIRWFLNELEQSSMGEGVKNVLRIVLYTGQRVEQVSRMQWADVDLEGRVWDVPPSETKVGKKTKVGHVVPLTDSVVLLLESAHREGPFVFPGYREAKPLSIGVFSKNLKKMVEEGGAVDPFTPRDLRRTVTTHMSRLGILAEIRNRIQDHAIAGVEAKHYDRHDYLPEKRAALEKWERELRRITGEPESEEDNVVQLRA